MANENEKNLADASKAKFETFAAASEKMIATSDTAYSKYKIRNIGYKRQYDPKEVLDIIEHGSLAEQQKLSYYYYCKGGFYCQLINYYATLLKYAGILIPTPSFGKNLSSPGVSKKYYQALDYVEKMKIPTLCTNFALKALIYGSYYGIIVKADKNTFSVLDLPNSYCCSRFKDIYGNDIIEFDLSYFDTILTDSERNQALSLYPVEVVRGWKRYSKNPTLENKWVKIVSGVGICFPFLLGRPYLLNTIPAANDYDDAIKTEQERDLEEIRKIIVQQIPHLQDGRLLFEPDEAAEMHAGAVGMMKNNPNVSVLTTYADVDAIISNTSDVNNTKISQMANNVYNKAGVSSQLFAATGSSTLPSSIRKDISLMMTLADKFSNLITQIINSTYKNGNVSFKYTILAISEQNCKDYIADTFKLASSGYSFLLPAIALGISQRDLGNIKDLENDVLDLGSKLIPLASAYTQSTNGEAGRPELNPEDKSEKTQQNEESLDNQMEQGGSE